MAGQFGLFEDTSGGHRLNLFAGNGHVVAWSESYKTWASAEAGIESVKLNAPDAPVADRA